MTAWIPSLASWYGRVFRSYPGRWIWRLGGRNLFESVQSGLVSLIYLTITNTIDFRSVHPVLKNMAKWWSKPWTWTSLKITTTLLSRIMILSSRNSLTNWPRFEPVSHWLGHFLTKAYRFEMASMPNIVEQAKILSWNWTRNSILRITKYMGTVSDWPKS